MTRRMPQEHALFIEIEKLAFERKGLTDVKRLLEDGADVNCKHSNGDTPLHCATRRGHVDIVTVLAYNGATVDAMDKDGFTPLHVAATTGRIDIIHVLRGKQADVSTKNKAGWSPLHSATKNNSLDVVKGLLELGARVDTPDDDGYTPLHVALSKDTYSSEVVRCLLEAGSNPRATTKKGMTARDLAAQHGWDSAVSHLDEQDAVDAVVAHFCAGECDLALAKASFLVPDSRPRKSVYAWLGETLHQRGLYSHAVAAFQVGVQLRQRDVDCLVGVEEVNDTIAVASAFGPNMLPTLAKDPAMRRLLRDKDVFDRLLVIQKRPSQYRQQQAGMAPDVLAHLDAYLERHRHEL